MNDENLHMSVDGHVATIELRRPPNNFFDREILAALATSAAEAQSQGARAIVLCSEGKHFCAGADFSGTGALADRREASRLLYREAVRVFRIELPVVAAVQGAAVGGGLGLAAAADFRVSSASSRFHANFASLGFHQGFGLSVTLPRLVGQQAAARMLYTSRAVDGRVALDLGLIDELAEEGQVRDVAARLAGDIARSAPLAVQSMKKTLRGGLADDVETILERELDEQSWLWQTHDSAVGIAASFARTEPTFTGR